MVYVRITLMCINHICVSSTYLEYGEGVISYYPCCQGNRGSSGCQIAKVDTSMFTVQCVYVMSEKYAVARAGQYQKR